jgi:hypothetical protein
VVLKKKNPMLKRLIAALARAWRIWRGNNAPGSRVPLWILGSSLYGVPGRFIKRTYSNDAARAPTRSTSPPATAARRCPSS